MSKHQDDLETLVSDNGAKRIASIKADKQKTIDSLTTPTYTVYNRTSLPGGEGYMTYDNSAKSIASVGNIFPVVLYVVAAMVTLATMTRFVDEERTNTGLFKALGYTNRQIIAKFVLYGLGKSCRDYCRYSLQFN